MKFQVVISGGGPVGMWLACELRLANISTLVLDQTVEIDPHSRALTVHPRTIEVLASRGAHEQLLLEGARIPTGHFAILDSRLNFAGLDTPYPFTLAIFQARTTALLQQRAIELGAVVRRGHRFVELEERSDSVISTIEGLDGTYTVESDYLVGCDGTRSTVRSAAGIDFRGTPFTVLGWLGDVELREPPELPVISKWGVGGTGMVVRLADGRYRVVGIMPQDVRKDWPGEFTLEELRANAVAIFGTDFGMHTPYWLSRYSNTSRQATTYRRGRVVVAGDAAHQHFPAGGVGLNVGVQDAMNLGWKLAATINGWAPEGLLDTYHEERFPVGQDLLEHTQAQTALMSAFTTEGKELRNFLTKLTKERPALEVALTERLTGLHVAYPGQGQHPLVGQRAPDLAFADTEESLFPMLRTGQYVLLDFTEVVKAHTHPHLRLHSGALADSRRPAWSALSAALVRPDGYVAWASLETDPRALEAAIDTALGATFQPVPSRARRASKAPADFRA
jgi:2-polyprenyl-6-methoxyphenol hydroxylase-like FAD-dependent oxidoreductase